MQILSLLHCPSLILAKASLTDGALPDSSANARATEDTVKGGISGDIRGDVKGDGGDEVTVVFSQRCARFLQLEQCASIRIHPPW